MHFRIIGSISNQETFASGSGIRELARLQRIYGKGQWKKRKGAARIELSDGSLHKAEIHWYEAKDLGQFEHKIKRLLD